MGQRYQSLFLPVRLISSTRIGNKSINKENLLHSY